MNKGILYLIPIPISEGNLESLSPAIKNTIPEITHFFVEDVRTARRFIKSIVPETVIDNLTFLEINKHQESDLSQLKSWIEQGHAVGVMSESGCPGIADPGADVVAYAQLLNVKVVPLVGPSSLLLALMASGFNGQSFCFNGYLPVKEPQRSKEIKALELQSKRLHQTQIIIETPYRNNHLLQDLLKYCTDTTKLCIAFNITASDQFIKTKTIKQWKQAVPTLSKAPCIFLILA
jgi:16S rRNA (cytidine1402-2'-O)-methyltransferase